MPALMGVGVGLPQLDAFGGSASNAVRNNLMSGLIPRMSNNVASTFALSANNSIDATGLNWLLQQQQQPYEEERAVLTAPSRNHEKCKAPKDRTVIEASTKSKRGERGNSVPSTRPSRWTQRYNELLEFKRAEGHLSLMDILSIRSYPGG